MEQNKEVQLMEVIVTTLTRKGDGKNTRMRIVTQVWSKEGKLIAENDPCTVVDDKI